MGIIGFSRSPALSVLLAPLQAVVSFFAPWRSAGGHAPDAATLAAQAGAACPAHEAHAAGNAPAGRQPLHALPAQPRTACQSVARNGRSSRLRVVRELEAGVASSCAGRMVISGRMADVCAELDRMAQREAAGC